MAIVKVKDGKYEVKSLVRSSVDTAKEALCEKMKASMVKITVEGVTGTMNWDANGEPTKEPKAMYIEDGSYKAM